MPTETLQLLAELLQSFGGFSVKLPRHKQQQSNTFVQLCNTVQRTACREASESVRALTRVVVLFAGVRARPLPHRELLQRPGRRRHLAVQKLQPEEQQQ